MHNIIAIAASAIVACAFAAHPIESRAEEQKQAPDQKLGNASQTSQHELFRSKLLEIAKVYETYGRVDDETRWAPFLCRMPMPSIARLSQSDDQETHGQKLYFLFAKDRLAYLSAGSTPSPLGQVIVKEAWKPKEVKGENKPTLRDINRHAVRTVPAKKPVLGGSYYPYASKDGKRYRASAKVGLYIMFKVDPKTEGTDQGWVYGTVTTASGVLDGKQPLKVTAVGRIESCMSCHQKANEDRLFGLRSIDSKEAKALAEKRWGFPKNRWGTLWDGKSSLLRKFEPMKSPLLSKYLTGYEFYRVTTYNPASAKAGRKHIPKTLVLRNGTPRYIEGNQAAAFISSLGIQVKDEKIANDVVMLFAELRDFKLQKTYRKDSHIKSKPEDWRVTIEKAGESWIIHAPFMSDPDISLCAQWKFTVTNDGKMSIQGVKQLFATGEYK